MILNKCDNNKERGIGKNEQNEKKNRSFIKKKEEKENKK